jgi:hypothetical protein
MNDTAEMIRGQMDETRSQLSDKLESLEHQVSRTVQCTGAAVNATVETVQGTVEAVQETVETVTGAVQDAVHSISDALDVRRQIARHPWLALGGSVVLGYLAAGFLARSKKSGQLPETAAASCTSAEKAGHENTEPAVQSAAAGAALAAAYESGVKSSSWRQLRSMAIGALMGIAQDVVSRAIPPVMNYLAGKRSNAESGPARASETSENAPATTENQ